jgi:hypothetical protein
MRAEARDDVALDQGDCLPRLLRRGAAQSLCAPGIGAVSHNKLCALTRKEHRRGRSKSSCSSRKRNTHPSIVRGIDTEMSDISPRACHPIRRGHEFHQDGGTVTHIYVSKFGLNPGVLVRNICHKRDWDCSSGGGTGAEMQEHAMLLCLTCVAG